MRKEEKYKMNFIGVSAKQLTYLVLIRGGAYKHQNKEKGNIFKIGTKKGALYLAEDSLVSRKIYLTQRN